LVKNGRGSYYICIPKDIIKKYKWQERQKLVIKDKDKGKLEIVDWKK
jgi:bifunctional DNA-binding transcriptional regulator/antitoxin component of YhaV-PrlF toxin-antitoxin module